MKRNLRFLAFFPTILVIANAVDGVAAVELDAAAAVALADRIPLLTVNLNNYKYHANPVLAGGDKGQWDEGGIGRPVVIRMGRDDWRMWYSCTGEGRGIGLASSKDGMHWTKHPGNPVLVAAEPWEEGYMSPTSVLQVNGIFYLYYWGPGPHVRPPKIKYIALATSEDGIHWTRRGEMDGHRGAVLGPEPQAINEGVSGGGSGVDAAKVLYLPEETSHPWRMIYTAFGLHGQWNGLAESEDGLVWQKTKAPIADHSGSYTRATGSHLDSGQTIRCPVRIGSVWAALSYGLDGRDSAPMVGLSLDRWITLGGRTLYRNQDYERGNLAPYAIEADDDWFYIYYSTGQRSVGLIRAPKRTLHQPIVLWEKQAVGLNGLQSMVLEADRSPLHLHVSSDRDGELRLVVWNPAAEDWLELAPTPVRADVVCSISPLPAHLRLRLKFTTRESTGAVSAWVVPE